MRLTKEVPVTVHVYRRIKSRTFRSEATLMAELAMQEEGEFIVWSAEDYLGEAEVFTVKGGEVSPG